MLTLTPTSFETLRPHRYAYLKTTTVPLDGMWEDAFFPVANHWALETEGTFQGYCAINGDGALLGFQVFQPQLARKAFAECLKSLEISHAYASTAEPLYLSLCLDHQKSVDLNALMYEDDGSEAPPADFPGAFEFRIVTMDGFSAAMSFGYNAFGPERLDWLKGYYTERIEKGELFGLWRGDAMVAAGELRVSPSQDGIADVGMVVSPGVRNQGLATKILQQLRHDGRARRLRLVCSTEMGNEGAQKAIARAGFRSQHRILRVGF